MTAVDTNVLVRFLVNDDQAQARLVRNRFKRAEQARETLLIPLLVVLETIWVLDSAYDVARGEIISTLGELLLMPIFQFENRAAVQALVYIAPAGNLDLADLLIAEAARLTGCQEILTFDKKATKHEMFRLIEE